MNGVRVGKRVIGADSPVTVGWDNLPKVEGGPFKRMFFTYFQPAVLLALVLFWMYAPDSIAKASTAIGIGIGFKVLLYILEWVNPRYKSWSLTWKELVVDLFYVAIAYTLIRYLGKNFGSDVWAEHILKSFDTEKFTWFTSMPLLVQAFLITLFADICYYWMHRGMHNWYPLWLSHSVHHYITQLNINKGQIGNPTEIFLIGLGIGGFFDFLPRAALLAGSLGMSISIYQHANIRFNTPRWWLFLFNTTEHHSVHHSLDYEASRSNYCNTYIFLDRIFGTCVDGEAELLGMEGGRRMSIPEQMTYTFTEGYKSSKAFLQRRLHPAAVPAE
ncbi:sterol desaturase family protein [Novosphingobium sp. 1949]|uniref:Sterol desaturase family protein n=1 Tax=Novosphingobium organovorum TaxID=2930092 RepID=A0ABT0BD68_9SPHN|nr:sterol desaturase family protein [Novosphingobium organovorum]MCJ2183012.1 sterol desaturase family protein [Novosphingobium organovorum]